jgi:hypothetical protein
VIAVIAPKKGKFFEFALNRIEVLTFFSVDKQICTLPPAVLRCPPLYHPLQPKIFVPNHPTTSRAVLMSDCAQSFSFSSLHSIPSSKEIQGYRTLALIEKNDCSEELTKDSLIVLFHLCIHSFLANYYS